MAASWGELLEGLGHIQGEGEDGWSSWRAAEFPGFGAGMSEHAGDHHGEEILVAEAGVPRHGRVLLAEGVGEALQLHADVDEPVQLDTGIGTGRALGVAGQQQLAELGAQVVAHLGESWEQGKFGLNLPKGTRSGRDK